MEKKQFCLDAVCLRQQKFFFFASLYNQMFFLKRTGDRMFTKKTVSYFVFVLALTTCFILSLSIQGATVGLRATCSLNSPWWTSKTHARADVYWEHPSLGIDLVVPHHHRVDYSLHARVGSNPADKLNDYATFKSTVRFYSPKQKTVFDSGTARWDGDGYASSSISVYNDQDNWRFCAKPHS
jgi:hypothetical protein